MKLNKRKAILIIITIIIVFAVISMLIFCNKKRSIIILDCNGTEIYKITDRLSLEGESEMLIPDNGVADSVVSQLISQMEEELDYSRQRAIRLLNSKDYIVYSTIDMEIQDKIDAAFNDRSTFTSTEKANFNQSAMVIMDYEGNIKGVATGNNNDSSRNRAATALFKVGSTIKPVAIYAPAIEENIVNFSTVIDDVPGNTQYNGQSIVWPTNYDNKYESNVTITDALKKSKNTIAVNVGKLVGEHNIFDFLKDKLQYTTLVESNTEDDDRQLAALALGYFKNGVTLDTLVSSYSIFGNGGYYGGKRYYIKVEDKKGEIIISNKSEKIKAISEETSTIMNRLLLNNIIDEDSIIKNVEIDGAEVLGKTGTVGGENDELISQLFVGMTPDYIAGVWVGYDDSRAMMPNVYNYPTAIWKAIMSTIKVTNNNFKLSENVIQLDYCSDSGLIKSDNCKNIKTGYYKEGNIPNKCTRCQ